MLYHARSRGHARSATGNPDIADRIAVHPVTGIGYDLYAKTFGQPKAVFIASLIVERSTSSSPNRHYYCQVLRNPALDDIEGARIISSPIQLFNRRQPRISLARI